MNKNNNKFFINDMLFIINILEEKKKTVTQITYYKTKTSRCSLRLRLRLRLSFSIIGEVKQYKNISMIREEN